MLLLAGATIAPTEATIYATVDHATPAATMTEAFAWLATAMAVGGAVGAASAGLVVDHAGPTAGFALAGGAGALAVLSTVLRSRTLAPRQAPVLTVVDTDIGEQFATSKRSTTQPAGTRPWATSRRPSSSFALRAQTSRQ